MSRHEVLKDFEKILDLSYKYCDKDMQDKEFEDFIQNLAQQINIFNFVFLKFKIFFGKDRVILLN